MPTPIAVHNHKLDNNKSSFDTSNQIKKLSCTCNKWKLNKNKKKFVNVLFASSKFHKP